MRDYDVVDPYNRRTTTNLYVKYNKVLTDLVSDDNKNYFFTAVGRLNKSFLAFLGISMAVVVLTEFTSIS